MVGCCVQEESEMRKIEEGVEGDFGQLPLLGLVTVVSAST